MSRQKVVIIGSGGHAREVLDVFDAVNRVKPTYDVIGYIVDTEYGASGTIVNDKPILGNFDWLRHNKTDVQAICGVGATEIRQKLVTRAEKLGAQFCSIIHPNAILTKWIQIGKGVVITAGCILTNQIQIGQHVHLNLKCNIAHDVIIEDFATLAPGVRVSGNVKIKEGCYVGTGSSIIEKITLGSWSTIGAGSTVIRDIQNNSTAVGIPAQEIKNKPDGWHLK